MATAGLTDGRETHGAGSGGRARGARRAFRPRARSGAVAGLALLVAVAAFGCAVRLISDYDREIDRAATRLQREMDTFLTRLEVASGTPAAGYAPHAGFYPDYLVALRSVLVRAQSHPQNRITEEQLLLMIDSLEQLRLAHEAGPLDPAAIRAARNLFNQAWRAIITVELAKKRGS
jgi:hypothetical protein